MSDYEQEIETKEEEINDIRSPDVVTKYRAAGDIANEALQAVIAAVKPGAKIVDLCQLGDDLINERLSKIYNKGKGKVDKGIGFPTCVSVNQIVGHFSPLKDNESTIKANDVVKV